MRYTLCKEDAKKIGKGAVIAILGALLTYLSEVIVDVDFGQYTPIVMAIWSVLVNIVRKWVKK